MILSPRADELLAKYPDQLDDEELAELRSLAEQDLVLSTMLDSIHEAEAILRGEDDPIAMSAEGEQALHSIVSETLDELDAAGLTADELFAPLASPSLEGSEALSRVDALGEVDLTSANILGQSSAELTSPESLEKPTAGVVSLSERRSLFGAPAFGGIAALLLLGVGYALWGRPSPPSPDLAPRAGDTQDLNEGHGVGEDHRAEPETSTESSLPARDELRALVVDAQPGEESRVAPGSSRAVTEPVFFEAALRQPMSLALLEQLEGGEVFVAYPAPSQRWDAPSGVSLLHPESASSPEFRPSGPGRADYILVGRSDGAAFEIPEERKVDDLEAFVTGHGAKVVDRLEIRWVARE